jgi:hypothetical protein
VAYLPHQTLFSHQVRQTSASIRGFPVFLPVSFGGGAFAQAGTLVDIFREGGRIRCPDAAPDMKYFLVEIRLDDLHDMLAVWTRRPAPAKSWVT